MDEVDIIHYVVRECDGAVYIPEASDRRKKDHIPLVKTESNQVYNWDRLPESKMANRPADTGFADVPLHSSRFADAPGNIL